MPRRALSCLQRAVGKFLPLCALCACVEMPASLCPLGLCGAAAPFKSCSEEQPRLPCPGLSWPGVAWSALFCPALACPALAWSGLVSLYLPCPGLACSALTCPTRACRGLPCPGLPGHAGACGQQPRDHQPRQQVPSDTRPDCQRLLQVWMGGGKCGRTGGREACFKAAMHDNPSVVPQVWMGGGKCGRAGGREACFKAAMHDNPSVVPQVWMGGGKEGGSGVGRADGKRVS
eukprot:278773-Chlamydomonas_euryale.AAC.4